MKCLSYFIKEELNKSTLININNQRLRQKKEALVAIKRGLSKKDSNELKNLAETTYASIGNYKTPDELSKAHNDGDISGYKELEDLVKEVNGDKKVDFDTMCDVIQLLANGETLDRAITTIAKKL